MSSSSTKIYFPLYQGALDVLWEVFHSGRRIDKTLEFSFKSHRKWGSKDRRWVAEHVYGCARQWRYFFELAGGEWDDRLLPELTTPDFSQKISRQLLESAFQIHLLQRGISLGEIQPLVEQDGQWPQPTYRQLASEFFHRLGEQHLSEWPEILQSQSNRASTFLRVNLLKTESRESLQQELQKSGVELESVETVPTALKLNGYKNVFQSEAYKNGWFEVQDAASQQVAGLVDPQPGERVIDACAGAGGKSLHLAQLMKNKGQIIALDIHQWKLNELKKRARRAGVHNIETRVIDSNKVTKRLVGSADRVLMDVPCSGSGVLRRNPDPKWRMNESQWGELRQLQEQLLNEYSRFVKPQGRLVYSTCSVLPQENRLQIENFLASVAGERYQMVDELFCYPHKNEFDGFYAAVLQARS